MNVADLIQAALSGSTRATGRLLSLIEGDRRDEVLAALDTASARVVGITGPPVTRLVYSRIIPSPMSAVSTAASGCRAARISDIG